MTKRIRAAAVGIGAVLVLGGCGGNARDVATSTQAVGASASHSSTPSRPAGDAVTLAEARAIMRSYDKANNRAIKASSAPRYDEKAWQSVDSGPVLAGDVFSTRLSKRRHDKSAPVPFTHTVRKAYGSTTRSSDGQPPWLLVTGTVPAKGDSGTPHDFAAVLVKESAGWRMWAGLGGDLTSMPEPSRTVRTLTAHQRQAAANSIALLGRALSVDAVDEIGNGSVITKDRADLHKKLPHTEMTVEPRPWGTPVGTDTATAVVVGTPAARLMRVGSVTLGLVSFANIDTFESTDGTKLTIDPDYAAVEGNDATPSTTAHRRTYQTFLVSIADNGKPTILGSSGGLLPKAGS